MRFLLYNCLREIHPPHKRGDLKNRNDNKPCDSNSRLREIQVGPKESKRRGTKATNLIKGVANKRGLNKGQNGNDLPAKRPKLNRHQIAQSRSPLAEAQSTNDLSARSGQRTYSVYNVMFLLLLLGSCQGIGWGCGYHIF